MRIITRPDFDGIVCDVLLRDIFNIEGSTQWVEPYNIEKFSQYIEDGDIIANLPFIEGCSLWFDHHSTNKIEKEFNGAFYEAPSAAGIIYDYYKGKFSQDFSELVFQTDKIDSGDISIDEVLNMEQYPYALLSATIFGKEKTDELYWNKVVKLLAEKDVKDVLKDREVTERCSKILTENKEYKTFLNNYTEIKCSSR
jgi:oligoribonuclease NrnB/cAMP/cGMP phosphodiesterase (DHH superfamily)